MKKIMVTAVLLGLTTSWLTGCTNGVPVSSAKVQDTTKATTQEPAKAVAKDSTKSADEKKGNGETGADSDLQVVANPESDLVLVNKQYGLPDHYEPTDLVEPNVPFTFKEKSEKRKMRSEAAHALENLFAGAKKDGISLAGVSAYRSYATQKVLFENYAKKDGLEKAKMYSAEPGHSEHETGLAIDVSGISGKCAASDCFGGTKEADWLAKHAWEYGFIIRYPKGKEDNTGYQYEPWHIRYVGTKVAAEINQKNETLEDYMKTAAVSK